MSDDLIDPGLVPMGFRAHALAAGIKASGRPDLSILISDVPAGAAGVFTKNLFVAAPVLVSRAVLSRSTHVRGVVVNAGNANAGTGSAGLIDAEETSRMVARAFDCRPDEILVASTGIIGRRLPMEKVAEGVGRLGREIGQKRDFGAVARAIMTTDTVPKVSQRAAGRSVILGMAKGAGMIHPDMATMLGFILTDAAVPPDRLRPMLSRVVHETFNAISIDNDMSTNDTVFLLANGASGEEPADFEEKLRETCRELAMKIIEDGEGATKAITIRITGAVTDAEARLAADAVATSMLFKTAMHGGDPNWGRILAALGRSGARLHPDSTLVRLGGITLFESGLPTNADLNQLAGEMKKREILVEADLGQGPGCATAYTTDLSREYVSINADYTT